MACYEAIESRSNSASARWKHLARSDRSENSYFMVAMVCKTPPIMAHNAMNQTHVPPWRLRASATVTIRNQCAVEERLKRQTTTVQSLRGLLNDVTA